MIMKAIINGILVTPDALLYNKTLLFDRKIAAILDSENGVPQNAEIINADGGYVTPGFVDIHVHGGGGADFLDGTTAAVDTVTGCHALHGTTSLLATTLTCPNETLLSGMECIVERIENGSDGAEILGLHLEGPYFAAAAKGAQKVTAPRTATKEEIELFIKTAKGHIVRWDAAPELPGTDLLAKMLSDNGILASVGHSAANAECVLRSFEKGFTHITHLYCSTTTEHKEGQTVHGGIIEAAYLEDGITIELIADGKHIPRETMLLAFKIKGAEKVALITDAMRAAGTDVTESVLGSIKDGSPVIVEDGVAKLPDRSSFAGSIGTMDRAFKVAVGYGVPVTDAVMSLSLTPARIIGADGRKGSLSVGKDSDILIFDSELGLKKVFIGGKLYN